eukprot:1154183-Pelagomonas_calceolata.AAC.5
MAFSVIVMYDAMGVRQHAGKQAAVLNQASNAQEWGSEEGEAIVHSCNFAGQWRVRCSTCGQQHKQMEL